MHNKHLHNTYLYRQKVLLCYILYYSVSILNLPEDNLLSDNNKDNFGLLFFCLVKILLLKTRSHAQIHSHIY